MWIYAGSSGCSLVQKLRKRLRGYVLTRFQRFRTFAHGNVKNRLTWGTKETGTTCESRNRVSCWNSDGCVKCRKPGPMFFRVTWLWVFSVIAWLIVICWDKWHSGYSKMRKRPSIASVYLVSVSRQCVASVYRICVSHQCIASVPTFETSNPSVLLHIRPFLASWKLLPQHLRASMSLVVSLVMSLVARSVWILWDYW